jgi:hypothetical protein
MLSWWPTWHIGVRLAHMSPQFGMNFFRQHKMVQKWGSNPQTTWSSKAFTTRLLLRLCCCASYYFFVLCSGVLIWSNQHENGSRTYNLSGLVSMVIGPTCPISIVVKLKLQFKFKFIVKFKFLRIYSTFCLNLNSSLSLNSNLSKFNSNSNLWRGPQFFVLLILFQILPEFELKFKFKLKFKLKFEFKFKFILNLAWIQTQV